jgi:hypothetical protein
MEPVENPDVAGKTAQTVSEEIQVEITSPEATADKNIEPDEIVEAPKFCRSLYSQPFDSDEKHLSNIGEFMADPKDEKPAEQQPPPAPVQNIEPDDQVEAPPFDYLTEGADPSKIEEK